MNDDVYIKPHLRHPADCTSDGGVFCNDHWGCLELSHAVADDMMRQLAEALRETGGMSTCLCDGSCYNGPCHTPDAPLTRGPVVDAALARYDNLTGDSNE